MKIEEREFQHSTNGLIQLAITLPTLIILEEQEKLSPQCTHLKEKFKHHNMGKNMVRSMVRNMDMDMEKKKRKRKKRNQRKRTMMKRKKMNTKKRKDQIL